MAKKEFPQKLHPLRSLVGRVLWIALFLLVIPLFLHTFFLYEQEYQEKVDDAHQILTLVGEGEKILLEQQIMGKAEGLPVSVTPNSDGLSISSSSAPPRLLPYSQIFASFSHLDQAPYPISLALYDADGRFLAGSTQKGLELTFPIPHTSLTIRLSAATDVIRELHYEQVWIRFLSLLFFIGILGGLLVWLALRRLARPLLRLCSTLERVKEGAIHVRYPPDRMGFEIDDIGRQVNQTLDALLAQRQETEKERTLRERLAEELRIGHEIQSSLFPSHIPELPSLGIATGYLPAREVGGDFYDLVLLPDGRLFIAIADTAGKGISACLYSLGLRSALRSFASLSSDLATIIVQANALFREDAEKSGMFATLWAALYDPQTHQLTYCNQGHVPPLLIRGGKVEELSQGGLALGVEPLQTVKIEQMTLRAEDLLLLYTDGIIEAHDPDRNLFGLQRLRECLLRAHKGALPHLIDQLLEEIHLFTRGAIQHDDLTLVALKKKT